ncbi:collagen alpha-1(II) chain-like [Emydura macquarii macquarii]|uniref:collagen alpha-1(II) chain-like n=1 Tax=Emydura macquarii macquarii TaxID=1129001 RepID=UPI00352AC132
MKDPQPGAGGARSCPPVGGPGSPARGAAHGPVLGRGGGEEPPPSAPPGAAPGTAAREGSGSGPEPGPVLGAEAPGGGAAPPAKARRSRVLSPVWEEGPEPEVEAAGAAPGATPAPAPGRPAEELFPDLLQHVSLRPGGRSPEPPLFRSFFAEECRAIARQLRLAGPELSAIEAEPLPLETTPVTPLCGPQSPGGPAPGRPEPGGGPRDPGPAAGQLRSHARGQEPAAPGAEQQQQQQLPPREEEEEGLLERGPTDRSPGLLDARPAVAGTAVRGEGAGDRQSRVTGLQMLAANALNLTFELQGSGHSRASFRPRTSQTSAAPQLGVTVILPVERGQMADQSGSKDSEAEDAERSMSAYRTYDLEPGSNESTVSLGSSSFATSTPLMGPAKFHFVAGSPVGNDLAQKDTHACRRSTPRELTCQSGAASPPTARAAQSMVSECGNLPEEESWGKGPLKSPQKSAASPVPSRSCVSPKDKAAVKSVPLPPAIPTARRRLALASSESWRVAKEILRVGLPPRGGGIATEGKTRLSLSNSRASLQKTAATGDTRQGSNLETQPASQLPDRGLGKPSGTKLTCSKKVPSSLRPPSRFPALSSSRPLLIESQFSLGPRPLSISKEAVASGTKLPTHPGTRLRLVKPGPSSLQHTSGTPQPACSLPPGNRGADSSPQDKETESVSKPGCTKPPVRRAATAVIPAMVPHSRLRPAGGMAAFPRRLPSPKRARLGKDTNSAAAAQALESSGADRLSVDPEGKPGPAVVQDLPGAGEIAQPQGCGDPPVPLSRSLPDFSLEHGSAAPDMQLPGQLLSRELQRAKSELQRVKNELAARDAQCEAYRRTISSQQRTISSLEAQLRAGSGSEGVGAKQDCALEGV